MISATTWVPRGFAKEFPEKYEVTEEELERITEMANLHISEAKTSLSNAEQEHGSLRDQIEIDDDLKEYDLEHYDEDQEDEGSALHMFPGLANSEAKYHENNDDPYITLPNEDEIQEEKAELQIYPTDNMILATRTEDDVSYLDVYVYDDGQDDDEIREGSLYVHHDMMLPAFPLCVEWINFNPKSENNDSNIGNFAAVGTFDPTIEIWNLDYVDKSFPDIILGEQQQGLTQKKKKKKNVHVTTHHTDAVLSLAHNKTHRSILASTSADLTVKLWDLSTQQLIRSMNHIHHQKQVSSSQWYNVDPSILLTGGYDSTVALSDVRINDLNKMTKNYKVGDNEDVEIVKFGSDSFIYAGTDKGNVYCFDPKVENKPIWTLHAHDAGISTLETNHHVNGLILTGAMGEKQTKVWKISDLQKPSMLLSRDFGCGNVLSAAFAPDLEVAGNVIIGGVTSGLKMWDCFSNRSVRSSFRTELKLLKQKARTQAEEIGKSSRIVNKYDENDTSGEKVLEVEGGLDDDEEEDEEEDEVVEEDEWEDEH